MLRIVRGLINLVVLIIELLLAFRLLLKFLVANPATPFVSWMYGITKWLVVPFAKIFPDWKVSRFVIDSPTLAAIIVYAVVALLILKIVPHPPKQIER